MSDSKYFTTTKKGEIAELRNDLKGDKREKKKDSIKKIIASMTVGKDVSSLFPDVINCMQTADLELKKLVYLYLMNYAKSQPDMAIMGVNTIVRDCDDPNPLIRALAVRTMGCIRVDNITEYLCDPLRKCLKDDDPYVRKTAAVCVAKMHDINSDLVEDQGFLDVLKDLLSDSNPMVVANAVASLSEICENSGVARSAFELNTSLVNKLLTALNECTEWGQVFVLDSIALYEPADLRETKSICERVTPRLAHANAAVVLSAVKVVMRMMDYMDDTTDFYDGLLKKLTPPLVTLLASQPEVQYVALRNISLILQKQPAALKHDIKVFFVKYNDPIYVKLEKLDVIIRLCSPSNIQAVLAELKEYASEVDVDFVRKAVRAIGRCAVKVESEAERAVQTLLQLIETKVSYVLQEAIVVIKDIFRKYPNKYEGIISKLCENLDALDEPQARAAMVWIIGEYVERIDNAMELLETFVESFADEETHVQLQILTAVVKLFLKQPANSQGLVQSVLSLATQDSDNPDLRDRGYVYWRLLSTDPAAAKEVVLAEKPKISEESDLLEASLLDDLIGHIATLASVYHKPPSSFGGRRVPVQRVTLQKKAEVTVAQAIDSEPAADVPIAVPLTEAAAPAAPAGGGRQENPLGDLLSMESPPPMTTQPMQSSGGDLLGDLGGMGMGGGPGAMDPFGGMSMGSFGGPSSYSPPKKIWLTPQAAKGLQVQGTFTRRQGQLYMDMTLTNMAMQPMAGFAVQFNKNSFGLAPAAPLQVPGPIAGNQSAEVSLPLNTMGAVMRMDPLNTLQIALKNNLDIFYFSCAVPYNVLWGEDGQMERKVFLATWKDIPPTNEVQSSLNASLTSAEAESKLQANNVFTIAKRTVDGNDVIYTSLKFANGIWVLGELKFLGTLIQLALKTRSMEVVPGTQEGIQLVLST